MGTQAFPAKQEWRPAQKHPGIVMAMEKHLAGRIVEVAGSWPAEVFIQRHVQALQNEGVAIQVAARHSDLAISSQASVQVDATQARISWIPNFDRLSTPKKVAAMLRYGLVAGFAKSGLRMRQRALLGFFAELKPDLIHFHNAQLAVAMNWICLELGIPYTVSLRGADAQEIPLRSDALYENTRLALSGASGIHTVCDGFGRSILLEGMQTTTIYTTVPVPDKLGAYRLDDKDGYHLLSLGRLQWRKGYPDLLVALRGLLDARLNVRLTIAGTGPDEKRVQYWIERLNLKEAVHLPGKLSFGQIQELLQRAHAYVQASHAEGLSNALAEAMAWGCPVFATDVAGTREVIRDGENGFMLEALAPVRWVERLLQVSDRDRMQRVRNVAHLEAKRRFDAVEHARKFVDFFKASISRYCINRGSEGSAGETRTRINGCVKDRQTVGIKVVISLPWEWQFGTDQALRALAPLATAGKIRLYCYGKGSAEDELRYLASFLGVNRHCIVRVESESLDCGPTASYEPGEPSVMINCPEMKHPVWSISDGERGTTMPVGETSELVRRVEDFLGMKSARSD
jgi:colanic acid/amylovoran biosynthesis glycosyltransferase